MNLLFDSFWRALAYCFRPRVIVLSIAPLLCMAVLSLGVWHFYGDWLMGVVRSALGSSTLISNVSAWMQTIGLGGFTAFLTPLLVIFAVMPVIVVMSLLLVAFMMTPALTSLVAEKRFPALERKNGGSLLLALSWSLVSTLAAMVAMVVSIPLWLIPPLILVLPPLIWGWLTYRVMAFDALAAHASKDERLEIFKRHRLTLLGIGVFCGYLGAAPSVIWASGVLFAAAFLVLIPLGVWLYTLVFALSSLWFSHYCLAALEALRAERAIRTDRRAPRASPATVTEALPLEPEALTLPHDQNTSSSPK